MTEGRRTNEGIEQEIQQLLCNAVSRYIGPDASTEYTNIHNLLSTVINISVDHKDHLRGKYVELQIGIDLTLEGTCFRIVSDISCIDKLPDQKREESR